MEKKFTSRLFFWRTEKITFSVESCFWKFPSLFADSSELTCIRLGRLGREGGVGDGGGMGEG
jgi:hypothetical protein